MAGETTGITVVYQSIIGDPESTEFVTVKRKVPAIFIQFTFETAINGVKEEKTFQHLLAVVEGNSSISFSMDVETIIFYIQRALKVNAPVYVTTGEYSVAIAKPDLRACLNYRYRADANNTLAGWATTVWENYKRGWGQHLGNGACLYCIYDNNNTEQE